MNVYVWFGSVAGITNEPQLAPYVHLIAGLNFNRTRLQMADKKELIFRHLNNDLIPARILNFSCLPDPTLRLIVDDANNGSPAAASAGMP
jgi:hypothetical protein